MTKMDKRSLFLRAAAALSLSSIAHYAAWSWALHDVYYSLNDNPFVVVVLMAANLVAAALIFALSSPSPRLIRLRVTVGIVACVLLGLTYAHWLFGRTSTFVAASLNAVYNPTATSLLEFLISAALLLLICTLACRIALPHYRKIVQVAALVLAALGPFAAILYLQGGFAALDRAATDNPGQFKLQGDATARSGRSIIFLVMDELDYDLVFAKRPPSLALPNLDRLLASAFAATRVTSPSMHTIAAVPSITTGRRFPISDVNGAGTDILLRTNPDARPSLWTQERTVFSEVHRRGLKTAVVGWYHPYCRLFGDLVDYCFWDPYYDVHWGDVGKLEYALGWYAMSWRSLLLGHDRPETAPGGGFGLSRLELDAHRHLDTTRNLERAARRVVRNGLPNLFYLHFTLPHWPPLPGPDGSVDNDDGYIRNLADADRFLGRLLSDLEDTGQTDRTAILLTGDHAARGGKPPGYFRSFGVGDHYSGRHVPLILSLPGDSQAVRHTYPIENTIAADLVLAYLEGAFDTHAELSAWIDARAAKPAPAGR
jgi:hypothetical protein